MAKRRRTIGLFGPWWRDITGHPTKRLTRKDYAEAYRLWAKHKDIREGKGPKVVSP